MANFLFYLFSAITVISAFLVVVNRDTVNAAMFMIVSFVGMAALFVLLQAYFIAIIQILVYAGAVMVLFLFIVMLLDVENAKRHLPHKLTLFASIMAFALLIVGCVFLFLVGSGPSPVLSQPPTLPFDATVANIPFATASRSFGFGLFTKYMLPFQVTGFLLLVAMIGVIVVSKKLTPTIEEKDTK